LFALLLSRRNSGAGRGFRPRRNWGWVKMLTVLKFLIATVIVGLAGVGGLALAMPDTVTLLRRTFYATTGITFKSLQNAEAACGASYAARDTKDPSHPAFRCFNKSDKSGPRKQR
jgi:hypothetical protein